MGLTSEATERTEDNQRKGFDREGHEGREGDTPRGLDKTGLFRLLISFVSFAVPTR
jgi:hypothetical protein